MSKIKFYVCPVCGNAVISTGDTLVSCCGITLPPQEPEKPDDEHILNVEKTEDEYYVTSNHEMTKQHFVSFIVAIKDNGYDFVKLYPEQQLEARFKISRTKSIYYYCNKHGLFKY